MAVVTEEWMDQQERDQQVLKDRILGQTTGLLAQRGDEQAVALLVDVRSMALADTDEAIRTEQVWDLWTPDDSPATRTIYRRAAVLDVDDHLVARFTDEVCQRIAATLSYVAERNGEENVAYVRARPALPEADGDWRAAYAARLASERPSNQARREPAGAKRPVEDGLTFGALRNCGYTGRSRACRLAPARTTPSPSRRCQVFACARATHGSPMCWWLAGDVP